MTEFHELDDGQLAALATGLGGAPVVVELVESRQSRHMLLVKYLVERWPDSLEGRDTAIAVLDRVQHVDRPLFDEVMRDPLVGAWLAATTRKLDSHRHELVPVNGDFLHLGALAASAASQAGIDCELTGYARQGRVTLPGAGEAVLRDTAEGPVTMSVAAGRITLSASAQQVTVPASDGHWHGLRRLAAGHSQTTLSACVEDANPYRAGYHAPPSDRLTAEEAARWQRLFVAAWDLIATYVPERAAELTVGLRAVIPLMDQGDGAARSGTARDSVGALGMTEPRTAHDLAETLVHEFQHSKLSAALDLVRLYVHDCRERHFAPWRTDTRPTSALIQGVYAFLGVAHLWHRLRAAPGLERQAERELATTRLMVERGIDGLENSQELTPPGVRFVSGMRTALDALMAEPLPDDALVAARSLLRERQAAWEAAHPGTEIRH
jgi:HEXXH motif-containing protein